MIRCSPFVASLGGAALVSLAPVMGMAEGGAVESGAALGAPHFFSAVSGAVAIACALTAASMWRRSTAQTKQLKRLDARLRSDLSSERVFVMHNGQPTPASPATDAYMRTRPDTKTLTNRGKLRQVLDRRTNEALDPLLTALTDDGVGFSLTGKDADGQAILLRGETVGMRAVLRIWPIGEGAEETEAPESDAAAGALAEAPVGALLFSADQRLQSVNAAARALLRLEGEDPPTLRALIDALRETGRAPERSDHAAWRSMVLDDPAAAFGSEPLWPLPDGDVLRVTHSTGEDGSFALFVSDETGPVTQERRAKTAQSVQQATIAAIDDGLAVVSAEGRVRLLNPAFKRLWGLEDLGELEGRRFAELLDPATADLLDSDAWRRITAAVAAPGPPRADAFAAPRSNGRRISVKLIPLPDGATLLVCEDVGDAHRVETALRERNEALEEAARLKTEFLQTIASQLRTPLHTVLGFADVLLKEGPGPLTRRQRDYVQGVMNSGDELLALVSDAVDLGALRAGAIEMKPAPVDIRRVVEGVAERITGRARVRGVRLETELPAREVFVEGDEARLEQAVFALATAAFSVSEKGDALTLTAAAEGEHALVGVAFAPGQGPTRSASPFLDENGSSVGISLATRIADLHGGGLSVSEQDGIGRALVRLPRLRQKNAPSLDDVA